MRIYQAGLALLPILFAAMAVAQDEKLDFAGDYTYFRFDPSVIGLQPRSFNGGGGSMQFNFNRYFGLKADLQDYGSTSWAVTYRGRIMTPRGSIPAGTYVTSNANLFTWVFGPVVRIPIRKVSVFGETLFGGSYTNAYASLSENITANHGTLQAVDTEHPFTMIVGGGVDVHLSHFVALRVGEVDYTLTRYMNALTNNNTQNGWRFVSGFVLTFGGAK